MLTRLWRRLTGRCEVCGCRSTMIFHAINGDTGRMEYASCCLICKLAELESERVVGIDPRD